MNAQLNIANGIREFAVATPNATAVVDGDRTLTYAALNDRANRVANWLLAHGLKPGDRVAVLLGNRLEYPEIACGLAKAGMVLVPVNPRLTEREVSYILEHSSAAALIADGDVSGTAVVLRIGAEYERALDGAAPADPRVETAETDPFCIAYTSGTTGNPRGVVIPHRSRALTFYCTALEWGLGPGRTTIAVAPMYHGAGFAFGYGALHVGGTLWMLRAFDPDAALDMLAASGAQSVFLVPTHAQLIKTAGGFARAGLTQLETLYFNAAPLPHELKLWVLDELPHVGLHEVYGSTEAGVVSNLRPPDQRRKQRCVGPPWFMTEVRLVDHDGNVVEPPGTGELYSRSPFLMNGYLDDPEATAACTTADGFLSSGDVCHMDDESYIYVVDRVKDMIITGGVNVYPREVEDVLRRCDGVADVAVVGVASQTWGEEIVAFVVGTRDAGALDRHCRASLAGFKVPRRFEFLEALPRNPAGKVLKRELREGIDAPAR
jgi:long-chain acyl-CoA synthetase